MKGFLRKSKFCLKVLNFQDVLTLFVILLCTFQTCESDLAFPIDALTESVKDMLEDGFTQKEIINNIKSELSLSRIKSVLEKMYGGQELSEEEMTQVKSGEIENDDVELVTILQKFGMNVTFEDTVHQEYRPEKQTFGESERLKWNTQGDEIDLEYFGHVDEEINHLHGKMMPPPKPDYAFSPYDLGRLAAVEELIYKPLKRYVMKVDEKLKILKSYIKDIEQSSALIARNLPKESNTFKHRVKAIVSNPLASYKMIRRFANQLHYVWKAAGEDYEEDLWNHLSKIKLKQKPPDERDWRDAIDALLRIQYYNGYKAKEFSEGMVGPIKSDIKFSAEECAEIGIRAISLKQWDFALEWLYLAKIKRNMMSARMIDPRSTLGILDTPIEYAITEHNKAWQPYQYFGKTHLFTSLIINIEDVETTEKMSDKIRNTSRELRRNEEYNAHTQYNFVSLCAGENMQDEAEKSRLHCWLERSKHPYFYISPMKMELLSDSPPLVQIYDVMSDTLINEVKKSAVRKLERSQVINYSDPAADDVSLLRTSSQTWMPSHDLENKRLDDLTKLIEKITGLQTRKHGSSEDFQIACYGTSHHYEEHLDAVQDERRTKEYGDRVATFMIYLSSVEAGGKTAFPVLGTAANSIKGSAVFWYNLKKNGEPDKRTWHGGCPVVHGIKWVMNNWILFNENIHTRPCGLSPDE